MNLSGGVIQQGSPAITNAMTTDLGLYSLNSLMHMRFVTNNAPFRFFSDGGATPQGGKELVSIEPDGTLRLNENDIKFRSGFPDGNHGIGWYGQDINIPIPISRPFANEYPNGPVLYGYDGGALGMKDNGNSIEKIVLRWDAAGNVGIGTTAPTEKLEVIGNIKATGKMQASAYASSSPLIFEAPIGTERARIDDVTGRFGIGTNNPVQMLDVNGKMNLSGGVIQKGGAPITSTGDLGLYSLDPATYMRFVTNGQPIRFYSDGNPISNNALVSIESNGNVGIGTTSPTEKLHIQNGSIYIDGEGQGLIVNEGGHKRVGLMKYPGHEAGIWRAAGQDFEIGRLDVSALPGTPTTFTTDMYVAGDGNVGIGTNNPQSKLDILNGSINIIGDPNQNAFWTSASWIPILKAPLGSVWRTTTPMMIGSQSYYLGFGMTSPGWYWSAASRDDYQGGPWYVMSLLGSGAAPTGWVLTVDGQVVTRVLDVAPDYVFEKEYDLMPLSELEKYKDKYKHLPEVPSGKELNKNGVSVGEMSITLLKKVEELTLYMIELEKKNNAMAEEIEKLKKGK
ncbi:MAG: hypothetical protein HY841_14740 [Bacteroidetes bacterium]|nr:hypothetical protein [Bacteroidota bacterium]